MWTSLLTKVGRVSGVDHPFADLGWESWCAETNFPGASNLPTYPNTLATGMTRGEA